MLVRDDPSPYSVINPGGSSPYLILGDHAGRAIPTVLGDLGLAPEAMDRHIAWDIGVAGLGDRLAAALDACFIRQTYSRLVLDCNRAADDPDQAPAVSDGTVVPGNASLSAADLAARRAAIADPYQARIAQALDEREARGQTTLIFSLHSFTPVFKGFERPWRLGVLHRGDSALSDRVRERLGSELGEAAGDNEPYAMDGVDFTVPLHADARGLDYLELEVRQDLIADDEGQDRMATFLAPLLKAAALS